MRLSPAVTRRRWCAVVAAAFVSLGGSAWAAGDPSLLGRKAPDWTGAVWLNAPPVQLADLQGKVILIRWWMGPGCPYCSATAPALREFHQEFHAQGLAVIGFYHHKAAGPLELEAVRSQARRFGFDFPVAVDPEWRNLKEWWLNTGEQKWTSVSFLLDRKGVVRHIHPGGQYVKGDKAYAALRSKIEELLAEEI